MLGRPLHDQEPLGLPVDAEFFAQLSLAGRGRGFADIDVAAGDVPLITVSLAYQQQPVAVDGIGIPRDGSMADLLADVTFTLCGPAAADRRVRIALDLDDLGVLDVDVLAAADRAVGADGLGHRVGDARPGLPGMIALGRGAEAAAVGPCQLPVDRPRPDPATGSLGIASPFASPRSAFPGQYVPRYDRGDARGGRVAADGGKRHLSQ